MALQDNHPVWLMSRHMACHHLLTEQGKVKNKVKVVACLKLLRPDMSAINVGRVLTASQQLRPIIASILERNLISVKSVNVLLIRKDH